MEPSELQAVRVSMNPTPFMGYDTIRVIKDPTVLAFDEPTFAKYTRTHFRDGTIAVKVFSKLLENAPAFARGFIGIAFRISENNEVFECIYLRPSNGRAEQQLRRNRSTQYFSFPDYKFERLRMESPGEYESYTDIGLNEWIDVKIEVQGTQAKLFVNGHDQPVLIVNDLKHGPDATGAIGLWVDIGTEGYFADIQIESDS